MVFKVFCGLRWNNWEGILYYEIMFFLKCNFGGKKILYLGIYIIYRWFLNFFFWDVFFESLIFIFKWLIDDFSWMFYR